MTTTEPISDVTIVLVALVLVLPAGIVGTVRRLLARPVRAV